MKLFMVGLLAAAGIAVTACSALSSTPSPTAQPTIAQAAQAAPTIAPTVAPAPTAPPPTAARVQETPTTPAQPTTAPASTAAAAQTVRLTIDESQSQASYRAREQLLGRNLPSDAIGTTKKVSGTIVVGAGGEPIAEQSQITVDLSQLQSDERRRDNFIKQDTLQTNRFPNATFVARDIEGLTVPLPTSGEATFQLMGDLTVHGVTRPVTWQVTATFGDTQVTGNATTKVNITDFGMTPPKAGPVLSIEDELTLEMAFAANREA